MSQTTAAPKTPPVGQPRFSRFLARLLTSPFGALAGKTVLVRYTGRVTSQPRQLPVNCWPIEGGYLIRVGRPEQKRWWRNFKTPWPIEIVRRGRVIRGTGLAVMGETERGREIAADYFATHRGAARRAGMPKLPKGERQSPEAVAAAAAGMAFVVVTPQA